MKYALLYKDSYYQDSGGRHSESYKVEYETIMYFDSEQSMLNFLRWKDPSKTFTPIEYEELNIVTEIKVKRDVD